MKICILGDTHFGTRNGSSIFSNYFRTYYTEVFFPFLKENNITHVFQMGDIFDSRKAIHINAITESKDYFFNKFDEHNIKLTTILGNHDIFFKDTVKINSPSLVLKEYKNIEILDYPQEYTIDNHTLLMLPWICQENYVETMDAIKNTKANFCFGHLELSGFAMYRGVIAHDGMDANIFDKFEYVFTGHFHSRSNQNNIYYTGTPTELTWSDYNDPKGFYIFDLDTRQLQFIENPIRMFHKVFYDDTDEKVIKNQMNNLQHLEQRMIKLIIKNKENPYLFDMFLEELYKVNPVDITIIEETAEVFVEELREIDETQDTITILNSYIDSIKSKEFDVNKLKNVMSSLYHEAVNLQ